MFPGDADCVIVIPAVSDNSIVILLLLGTGMLMDMGVLILILTPILLPIAKTDGMDSVRPSIVVRVNLGIGLVTPPVGISLIVARTPQARLPLENRWLSNVETLPLERRTRI